MTPDELRQLILQGENSGVEFKRDDLRPEQLAREVVALANFQGGRVLIGVEDDGRISGIQRKDLEQGDGRRLWAAGPSATPALLRGGAARR